LRFGNAGVEAKSWSSQPGGFLLADLQRTFVGVLPPESPVHSSATWFCAQSRPARYSSDVVTVTIFQRMWLDRITNAQPTGLRYSVDPPPLQESFDQERFEEPYQKLGRLRGPDATPEMQRQVRRVFVQAGRTGARWLVNRIRDEWSIDALSAVSFLLAELGLDALEPILEALENNPSEDVAEYLLRALWRFPQLPSGSVTTRVVAVLMRYQDPGQDSEIRAAAYRASSCLAPGAANALQQTLRLLAELGRLEPDWDTYGSEPPTKEAIAAARHLIEEVQRGLQGTEAGLSLPFAVVPLSGGGVQIEWRGENDSIEVEIGPRGEWGYLLARGAGPVRKFEEGDGVARSRILELVASVVA
jgi:hypothetical protein